MSEAVKPSEPEGDESLERALEAERAVEELAAERARLWAELHRRAAAEHELRHYRKLVEQMEASKSWRLTAPARGVTAFGRDLRSLAGKARHYLADRRASR